MNAVNGKVLIITIMIMIIGGMYEYHDGSDFENIDENTLHLITYLNFLIIIIFCFY